MAIVAGSIESVTIASRPFACAADAEVNLKLGGFENEVQANGNGSSRIIKTRVPPMIGEFQLAVDPDNGDQEYLQEIADGKDFVPIVVTYASGKSYQGSATITGEFQASSQSGLATVTLSGTGTFTLQS